MTSLAQQSSTPARRLAATWEYCACGDNVIEGQNRIAPLQMLFEADTSLAGNTLLVADVDV